MVDVRQLYCILSSFMYCILFWILFILFNFIVGGGRARRALGARRTARPNMTNQNTKSNFIWMEFGIREFTKALTTNFDPPSLHQSRLKFINRLLLASSQIRNQRTQKSPKYRVSSKTYVTVTFEFNLF